MQPKSPRGVQQQEVSLAADVLLSEKLKPTIERVRSKLGRGSPNTVGPMLDAWFSTLGGRLGISTDSAQDGVPPATVQLAMHEMWKTALFEANAGLETTQASFLANLHEQALQLNLELANIQVERASMTGKEQLLNDALQQTKSQLQSTNDQISQLQKLIDSKSADLQQVNAAANGIVAELNIERKNSDERAKQYHNEFRALSSRFEATERRLLTDLDRERQIAKKAQLLLGSTQLEFNTAKLMLTDAIHQVEKKLHASELKTVSQTEKISAYQARIDDLVGQINSLLVTKKKTPSVKVRRV